MRGEVRRLNQCLSVSERSNAVLLKPRAILLGYMDQTLQPVPKTV